MKTIRVECDVTYTVQFDCEIEVPDDIQYDMIDGKTEQKIRDQIVEAAKEYDALLEVEDVDWFVL